MTTLILRACLIASIAAFSNVNGYARFMSLKATSSLSLLPQLEVPTRGLTPFVKEEGEVSRGDGFLSVDNPSFTQPSAWKMWLTRVLLWFQPPWRKVPSRTILKVKLGGSLTIEPSSPSFSFGRSLNYESIDSLYDLSMLLMLGAYDPRVKVLLIDLRPLNCGYAKLKEARRMLDMFRSSGKQIIGYAEVASEKEVYLSMGFTEFYIPPEGTLDLRGFSASATFLRGAFEKIGIEPQVQRIGKYKSFGDTFNRTSIADPQREVISALLTQASAHWAEDVARRTNRTVQEVAQLWSAEKALSLEDYQQRGIITGVRYWDQVEQMAQDRLRRPGWLFWALRSFVSSLWRVLGRPTIPPTTVIDRRRDEDSEELRLEADFQLHPRRQLPLPPPAAEESAQAAPLNPVNSAPVALLDPASAQAVQEKEARAKQEKAVQAARRMFSTPVLAGGLYLRKMRNGCRILPNLPVREVTRGRRIAIINAAGAIGSGESNRGGLLGASVGAETLTAQLRRARDNPSIKAVVLRIDSPGGSALASDILWREIRLLSRVKPVVASQVDVAASGGYFLSMACDQIMAEELTLTGSIGVVAAKFNAEKLSEKLGLNTDTISIGRFAEVFSTSRGFNEEEEAYFAALARRSYDSFVAKAAVSRGMCVADMEQVAQGRVWTGQQAVRRGLADHLGGLYRALQVAEALSTPVNATARPGSIRVQTLREARSVLTPLSLLTSATGMLLSGRGQGLTGAGGAPQAVCEESALLTGLVGRDAVPDTGASAFVTAATAADILRRWLG